MSDGFESEEQRISRIARDTFATSLDATGDHGVALDAAHEAVAEVVGGRTGMFDDETMTWTFDEMVLSTEENGNVQHES